LNAFKGCAEFTSFRDYTLELESGRNLMVCQRVMPVCKSASFVLNEGRCLLRDQNSLSKADLFREHLNKNESYFENGCEQFFPVPEQVQSEAQMVRILLKSVLRSIRIQPQVSDESSDLSSS
uniref:Apple domain-containing protein n=1 Tax=Toxocara canis TaxID=6265 RepID=A0A183U4G9_TOXCA